MNVLSLGQIDAWTLRISQSVPESEFAGILSPDEFAKGLRFVFPKDRYLSWHARAALRILLGRYLEISPGEIHFNYEARGRPILAAQHASDLQFSVSHSGEMVALAFSRGLVGVDIEHFGRPIDADLLQRWGLAANQQREFLQLWTRNEAYLKALGVGISEIAPQAVPPPWTFYDLSAGEYIGVVAAAEAAQTFHARRLEWIDGRLTPIANFPTTST